MQHAAAGYDAVMQTPINRVFLGIVTTEEQLVAIDFLEDVPVYSPSTPFSRRVVVELAAYFRNPRHPVSLPCNGSGTVFQRRVWQALTGIPAGQTLSYGELAGKLGSTARPVGGACRANPLPIIVPCHRIVSRHGIGGYCGENETTRQSRKLVIKEWLLRHEQTIPA